MQRKWFIEERRFKRNPRKIALQLRVFTGWETFWMFSQRSKVGARLGPILLLNGTMHVLKKGRKRNESHVERTHEEGVIHTMSSPRKEDGERERRRWRGEPGIKGSLQAASSVLTLSPGRSVDITKNSRRSTTWTHTLHLNRNYYPSSNNEKRSGKWGESKEVSLTNLPYRSSNLQPSSSIRGRPWKFVEQVGKRGTVTLFRRSKRIRFHRWMYTYNVTDRRFY